MGYYEEEVEKQGLGSPRRACCWCLGSRRGNGDWAYTGSFQSYVANRERSLEGALLEVLGRARSLKARK